MCKGALKMAGSADHGFAWVLLWKLRIPDSRFGVNEIELVRVEELFLCAYEVFGFCDV